MLRDTLIDVAIKLGVDRQLRSIRATVQPAYRHQRQDNQQLRQLLKSVLRRNSNCIDIGAYRGRVLAEIIQVAPQGRHIAFEPLPHLYKDLVKRFPGVDVHEAAVSNVVGLSNFTYVKKVPACSGLNQRTYSEGQTVKLTVRTEKLDHCLPDGYVPSLIKIDVEGAERLVIEGALETIRKYHPVILFEHGKGAAYYNTRHRDIYELLHERAGLNIFDLEGNGPYSLDQFERICELDEHWDYVASYQDITI